MIAVWPYDDHIVVLQGNVGLVFPVEDIVVHIEPGHAFIVAIHLNIAQRTDRIHSSGHIQRIEQGSQRRQSVGARDDHFAGNIHPDAADFPQRDPQVDPPGFDLGIHRTHLFFDGLASLRHRLTAEEDHPDRRQADHSVGTDGPGIRSLGISPQLDQKLIAGRKNVIFRSRHVEIRLESQIRRIENLTAEHPTGATEGPSSNRACFFHLRAQTAVFAQGSIGRNIEYLIVLRIGQGMIDLGLGDTHLSGLLQQGRSHLYLLSPHGWAHPERKYQEQ